MKIHVLSDRVLVERIKAKNKTEGGIYLPDNAKIRPQKGKVIDIGEGKLLNDGTRREMQVKKGDVVLFTGYAGTGIKIEDKNYLIMNETDIVAIMKD